MKIIIHILLVITFALQAAAQQYSPLRLFDMAASADLVTYGVITRLEDKFFYLECFNEQQKRTNLRVLKFAGKAGSYRWAPYETGQQVFVFLRKMNRDYMLVSPGAEAEIPVIRDSLVIDMNCFLPETIATLAPKGITPAYRQAQTFDVGKKKIFGLRFTPLYLYQSILAFRDCYQVILKRPNSFASFSCFNFFDRTMREKSGAQQRKYRLMKLMHQDMEAAQIKNCR